MSDLGSRWAKADRAKHHLDQLEAEVAEFIRSDPYFVVEEVDANQRGPNGKPMTVYTFRGFVLRDRPDWGPLIGDVLNNLRSVLDHLTWHLAEGRGDTQTEFPIFKDGKVYERKAPDKIRHLPQTAQTRIERQQPWYQAPDDPEGHPLWVLHRLTNDDKHQRLHITQSAMNVWLDPRTRQGVGRLLLDVRYTARSFEHGAVITRLGVQAVDDGVPPEVEMNPKPTYLITFDPEGPARGAPVTDYLQALWGRVVGILAMFDGDQTQA